jgi:hypothetical protein
MEDPKVENFRTKIKLRIEKFKMVSNFETIVEHIMKLGINNIEFLDIDTLIFVFLLRGGSNFDILYKEVFNDINDKRKKRFKLMVYSYIERIKNIEMN